MGELQWEVLENRRGKTGARQGVALNTNGCLNWTFFQIGGATCIKEECHPIKTQRQPATHILYGHTYSSYHISGEYAKGVWLPCL